MPRRPFDRTLPAHLLYGEGPSEVAFLTHLKCAFHARASGFRVRVDGDEGGDPANVLARALKLPASDSYDARVILIDTDRPWCPTEVIARAAAADIRLLHSAPCLEGLLLRILNLPVPASTRECKRSIYSNHLPEAKLLDPRTYQPLLPPDRLAEAAERIPTLAALIRFLQTGDPPETILP